MTDSLEIIGDPAFKGSSFTAQEYKDAWGDDWHTVFMQIMHEDNSSEICDSRISLHN